MARTTLPNINQITFSSPNFNLQKPLNLKAFVLSKDNNQLTLQVDNKIIQATTEVEVLPGYLIELEFKGEENGNLIYKLVSSTNLIKNNENFLSETSFTLNEENLNLLFLLTNHKIPLTKENFLFFKNHLTPVLFNKEIFKELLTSLFTAGLKDNPEIINFLKLPFLTPEDKIIDLFKSLNIKTSENEFPLAKFLLEILAIPNNFNKEEFIEKLNSFLNKDVLNNLTWLKQVSGNKTTVENQILNYFLSQQLSKEILNNFGSFIFFTIPLLIENKFLYVNWWMEKEVDKLSEEKKVFKILLKIKTFHLGIVEILLSFINKEIFVSFLAETEVIKQIFKNNLSSLQENLNVIGFAKILLNVQKQNKDKKNLTEVFHPVDIKV